MKKSFAIFFTLLAFAAPSQSVPVSEASGAKLQIEVTNTCYAVVERGPHHRVWQRIQYEITSSGEAIPRTSSYTELGTGLCYQDRNGKWVDSQEVIQPLASGGAAATNGQHQAYFPWDIYSGAIAVVMPEGKRLLSRPLGIGYFDGSNSVLIAELTNSIGLILPSRNEVIYTNAFTDFAADLVYSYSKAGFEQNVVIRSQPPAPAEFGLDPAKTRLQMLTEFFSPPQPGQTAVVLPAQGGLALPDESLDFGSMKIGLGRAFLLGNGGGNFPDVLVAKAWLPLNGRQFLVEELPVQALAPQLRGLPQLADAGARPRKTASHERELPPSRLAQTPEARPIRMANNVALSSGVMVDYTVYLSASQTNYTFKGDGTYVINNAVNLYQTTTIEGGAVIKYRPQASLTLNGPVVCKTDFYRPALFTAYDDNSAGEVLGSGNPSGYYANPAIALRGGGSPPVLEHVRIAYANQGLTLGYVSIPIGCTVRHSQFVNVGTAFYNYNSTNLTLENVLVYNVSGTVFYNTALFSDLNVAATHLTVHDAGSLTNAYACYVVPTNSLFVWVTNGVDASNWSPCNGITNSDSVFATAGAGSHYLATDSIYRDIGTTNLSANLLADLKKLTTYPPLAYTNLSLGSPTVWSARVPCDTDMPDYGYHYDPMDYWIAGLTVGNKLILTNGVAVGCCSTANGAIQVGDSASLISDGTPLVMNRIFSYPSVQELRGGGNNSGGLIAGSSSLSSGPDLELRFTDFPCVGGQKTLYGNYASSQTLFANCWMRGGTLYLCSYVFPLGGSPPCTGLISFTNNLLERGSFTIIRGNLGVQEISAPVILRNNLFWRTAVTLRYNATNPISCYWNVQDNAFDNATIVTNDVGGYLLAGKNGYVNTPSIGSQLGSDVSVATFDYATGPLGPWYQASTDFIDQGSQTADLAGLYHYTTQTSLNEESTTTVDIGYHYVAADSEGNPLDYDSDGIPDYLEDANGNGVVDSGETDWQSAADPGLKVIITQPKAGSAIP